LVIGERQWVNELKSERIKGYKIWEGGNKKSGIGKKRLHLQKKLIL